MSSKEGYWFKSYLFGAHVSEELESNPRMYGREPATWIKEKMELAGYSADVFPEDWGWCIQCQQEPIRLYLGCSNVRDYGTTFPGDPPPKPEDIVWHVFPFAEVPLMKRLFSKIDASTDLSRLDTALRIILAEEQGIKVVTPPEDI